MQLPPTVDHASVEWLNRLDDARATVELSTCCAADSWVRDMLGRRPFPSHEDLLSTSDALVSALDDEGLAQALAAHARIGERRAGESREDRWSRDEQTAALGAGADARTRLELGNQEYERKFGHVFLIRAAGRSAEEMYDALEGRLANDEDTERIVVLHELAEITRLRLAKLVTG